MRGVVCATWGADGRNRPRELIEIVSPFCPRLPDLPMPTSRLVEGTDNGRAQGLLLVSRCTGFFFLASGLSFLLWSGGFFFCLLFVLSWSVVARPDRASSCFANPRQDGARQGREKGCS